MYLVYLLKLVERFFKIETPLVDPFIKTLSLSLIFSCRGFRVSALIYTTDGLKVMKENSNTQSPLQIHT